MATNVDPAEVFGQLIEDLHQLRASLDFIADEQLMCANSSGPLMLLWSAAGNALLASQLRLKQIREAR